MSKPVQPDRDHDLFVSMYSELRRVAAAQLRDRSPSLQPTALVHEAWLRLQRASPALPDRVNFLAAATTVIRNLLIDHVRARRRLKRNGGRAHTMLVESELAADIGGGVDVLDLHQALLELAELDSRKARVIELRVFAGATIDETAASLGISHMTVSSDWRMARAWLAARLQR